MVEPGESDVGGAEGARDEAAAGNGARELVGRAGAGAKAQPKAVDEGGVLREGVGRCAGEGDEEAPGVDHAARGHESFVAKIHAQRLEAIGHERGLAAGRGRRKADQGR